MNFERAWFTSPPGCVAMDAWRWMRGDGCVAMDALAMDALAMDALAM
jgi:hypothetical protein